MKKIILDCGSHLGESVQKFRNILNSDECIFYMFEANTYLYNEILLDSKFNDCIKHNLAVSNKKELVKFYGCTKNKHSVGSTIEKSKASCDNISEDDYIEIQSINLADFIKNNLNKEDYIILKLDIEGSEYDVLDELIKTDIIFYINELYCEFHSCWMSSDFIKREEQIENYLQKINLKINYWDAL
jgi:FkbM family methyltransferase